MPATPGCLPPTHRTPNSALVGQRARHTSCAFRQRPSNQRHPHFCSDSHTSCAYHEKPSYQRHPHLKVLLKSTETTVCKQYMHYIIKTTKKSLEDPDFYHRLPPGTLKTMSRLRMPKTRQPHKKTCRHLGFGKNVISCVAGSGQLANRRGNSGCPLP